MDQYRITSGLSYFERSMGVISSVLFLLLIVSQFHRCSSHAWTHQRCSIDRNQNMPDGIVGDMNRFPWLGVVKHGFKIGTRMRYAITSAVLVHSLYAIASAEDISRIPVKQMENNTKLLMWGSINPREVFSLDLKDYILHPQYKADVTTATIALLSLVGPAEFVPSSFRAPVWPICMPLSGGTAFNEMYAIRLTDEHGTLEKEILRMDYVDNRNCENFYYEKGLYSEKFNPINPVCAMSTYNKTACVWDSGTALVVRQSFGFWQLIGLSAKGPGCGAPTKFINIHDYLPWMNDIISSPDRSPHSEEYRIGIRRVGPYKLIMFNPQAVPKSLGQCEKEDRGRVLFKDWGEYSVNKDFVLGCYLMVVSQIQSVMCGEVFMEGSNQRSNTNIWIENNNCAAAEGVIQGQERTGDVERMQCFIYFKSSAFIEFRFTFSFKAVVTAILYGHEQPMREKLDPNKKTDLTTDWWPTDDRLKMGYFAPISRGWYNQ